MGAKRTKKPAARAAGKAVGRDAQGRVHLRLQRDAHGRLALTRPLFEAGWQNDVALGAANTAHAMLMAGHTLERAAELGRNAMAGTSKLADGALASSPDRPLACRAGCAHCCHQAVGVTPPEALAIYVHLRDRCTPAELEAWVRRLREADDRTRGMTSDERLSPAHPCPFLEDARCTIYDVRPLACRGSNSLDADVCERSLRDPEARAALLAGKLSIPCYLEPLRAFHAVTAGLQIALDELHGLDVLPLELTAAMRILLDDPETVAAQWLGGKSPFEAARGGDDTSDPRIAALSGAVRD